MCILGTPSVSQGGPSHSFQAKNQHVVVPLLRYTMHLLHGSTYAVFAWDSVGFVAHT
jgi:hypothetical protein